MKMFTRIKEKYINTSLSNKLIIAICITFSILFLLIIAFNQYRTIKVITNSQSKLSAETLFLKQLNFGTYYNELENYSLMLRSDTNFMQIIGLDDIKEYNDKIYIKNALTNMFYARRDISELKLYLVNEGMNYTISKQYPNIKLAMNPDFNKVKEFAEASKETAFKYIMPAKDGQKNLLKMYRAIINIQDEKTLAYVEITVDNSYINKLIQEVNADNQNVFCLLDKNDNIYNISNPAVIKRESLIKVLHTQIDYKYKQLEGSFITTLDNVKYLFIYSYDRDKGWIFLSMVPINILNKSANETRNISIFMIVIALIISMFAISVLITKLLRPLRVLAEQMEKAGGGDFGATITVDGSAEIKHLESKFNSMLAEIDELIEKSYTAEIKEKTARLKALEAQINPHFLYNTLQMISTQAIINNQKDISNMVLALSSILRYSITDNDMVPLCSEISYVNDYLSLQKARFDERLDYKISIENKIEDLLLPKISIMTMVENSIKHGMETTLDKIQINIEVKIHHGYLVIKVSDNGKGMSPERLEYVIKQIKIEGIKSESIGLSNLADRLHILYGNLGILEIDSIEGEGTTVKMRIPVNENIK